MSINIYLIRHGKTEWNLEGRLQGSQNSNLVEEGILGAKTTGQALSHIPFSACYSSLQKRAQDTADYIIGDRTIPHFHHRGLNEFDFGLWEGKKSVDLAEHPEYKLLRTKPAEYQAIESQGEIIEQLYQRATQAFEQIVQRHQDGDNVLIVSHGMTLTLLTAVLKGLPWREFRNLEKHEFVMNTAINVVQVEQGKASLVQFNDVSHLNL
ncbi:Phosphoglycerate mutase [Bibersteinia trehalosi USDA-ARS-USMARC-188]|uniref:phosphoglycerate mutase (2,3-diphosphoglycerate-dependent) n=2 Tax=Bibersteinia trehalosi TaxID=47735 RepID=A0A4V7I9K5_BIBTR|nr:histidine phosphatase family protein [Bibersteinia trehalosi]AGH38516.1 Phosphoglycerate mutase [Bibersteinia trehalosi USDA-ARS-USMARC-192]AHG81683.1 Phosphoglycerate mutase [Bibersteinia trehalosi USDA-ARS-USMARC-188]AHG83965.1 Phosphoglycerate mutase [Bibersteinia trehalosi USDA-ARS-USMARC-189]